MASVLLVEGRDDAFVFRNLFDHYRVRSAVLTGKSHDETLINIRNEDGLSRLWENLPVRLKDPTISRLGIVVDANGDVTARWREVRTILTNAGYEPTSIPDAPEPAGIVIEQTAQIVPVIGVWLMPDNQRAGALEDFIKLLIPTGDLLWNRAVECADGLPEQRFPESHRVKAHIHTWLSWQKEPGTPMGLAITMKVLLAEAEPVQPLIAWVRRLFAVA